MRISDDFLNRMQALRDQRRNTTDPWLIDQIKRAKQQWWDELRAAYNLPEGVKFKVELDGELAGELRYKSTGLPYQPAQDAASALDTATDVPSSENAGAPAETVRVKVTEGEVPDFIKLLANFVTRPRFAVLNRDNTVSLFHDVDKARLAAAQNDGPVLAVA